MARTIAELPKGTRITDYMSLGVLTKTFPLHQVKAVLAAQGKTSRRQRDLPTHVTVYYVIALALFMQVSYREVLRCLLEGLAWLLGPSAVMKVTGKSGISQARRRLGWEVRQQLHEEVVKPLAVEATKGAWYRRWRLLSLDGSTLEVADEKENEQAFGRPAASRGASAYPRIRFVSLVENGTHGLLGTRLGGLCDGRNHPRPGGHRLSPEGHAVLGGPPLLRLRPVEPGPRHGSRSALAGEKESALGGGSTLAGRFLAESYLGLGTGPAASRERRGGARDRLSLAGHRRGRTDLPPGDDGSRPDRLSFLHAVRVIRRKLPTYGALPPSGEESIP